MDFQALLASPITMMVLIIIIFYFMMIRPQRKREKEINNFRNGLQPGQEIVTSGGIYGKVKSIDGHIVNVEVANGVVMRFDKSAIYAANAANQETK